MLFRIFMWVDLWYAHRLRLPGSRLICDAFERYATGDDDG